MYTWSIPSQGRPLKKCGRWVVVNSATCLKAVKTEVRKQVVELELGHEVFELPSYAFCYTISSFFYHDVQLRDYASLELHILVAYTVETHEQLFILHIYLGASVGAGAT